MGAVPGYANNMPGHLDGGIASLQRASSALYLGKKGCVESPTPSARDAPARALPSFGCSPSRRTSRKPVWSERVRKQSALETAIKERPSGQLGRGGKKEIGRRRKRKTKGVATTIGRGGGAPHFRLRKTSTSGCSEGSRKSKLPQKEIAATLT